MKKLLSLSFALIPNILFALSIGDSAPMTSTKMTGVNEKQVSIKDVEGKVGTLVFFTCNHCPFSKAWEARYSKFGNALMKDGKIGVIAINSNDPKVEAQDGYPQMKEKAKRLGMNFPYVVDEKSELAKAYGADKTPEFFLFDAKMKLVYHGAFDDNAEDEKAVEEKFLENAVQEFLAKSKITKPETRARGCKIKFRS